MNNELTKSLANYAVATSYSDLPDEVIKLAKNSFLDTVGITLAGSVEAGSQIIASFAEETGGPPVASIVGKHFKTSSRNAALANGTTAHILGFSDLSVPRMFHPSISVLPSVLALSEEYRVEGKHVILAYVIGVEVCCKIASALNPELTQKGWHPCSIFGSFGAAAGAGKIIGLDDNQMANALGIAGMETAGLKVGMGTMTKAYGAGRAAENGVVASMLAEKGFSGPTNVFEGRDGFLQTFGDGVSGQKMLENLGDPYDFMSPGITLKPYPSCTCSHTSIAAILSLKKESPFSLEDIESVICSVSPAVANYMKFPNPKNLFEAKYSLEYCVAVALVDGKVDIQSFSNEKLHDRRIRDTIGLVEMRISPELAELGYSPSSAPMGSEVTVQLKNGKRHTCRKDKGPWEHEGAPSESELISKYETCASLVLDAKQIEQTIGIILDLEKAEEISSLMDIIRG
jgi:2-methylcitrate dehydratase PrpD